MANPTAAFAAKNWAVTEQVRPINPRKAMIRHIFKIYPLSLFAIPTSIMEATTRGTISSKEASSNLNRGPNTLSFSQMDREGTSTLITRITSDINQVQSGVNLVLRLFLRSPFIVFGAMIMAFTVDGKAALIFVVVIPILSVIVFGIMLISIPLYKKVQGALDRVLGITRENLTGVRVIRAFGQEEAEVA